MITLDEIINTTKGILTRTVSPKTVPTKTIPTKSYSKNLDILLTFLLITIALLIALSIYCYFIKYQAKEKHLLSYHITNDILKEILY